MHFMALVALVLCSVACKPDGPEGIDPGDGSGGSVGGKVPSELVGKWSYGIFSPTDFWGYNGQYIGNAYEQALVFDIHADGTYEEYVINSSTAYSCRTEAYTYFKGRIKVDADARSFVITPTEGTQRGYYSCAPKSNFKRPAKASELKQETMNYKVESGKSAVLLSDAENPQGVRLETISW